MGRVMLSKCLNQFSVGGRGCVPSWLFDLSANCGGGSEDNGDLLQKVLCTRATLGATLSAPDPVKEEEDNKKRWQEYTEELYKKRSS